MAEQFLHVSQLLVHPHLSAAILSVLLLTMKPPRLSSLISPHCYDFTYLTGSMLPLLLFSYRDMESFDEDWNKINHINKITVWQQTRTKYKVAFPHLYNSLPHSMHISIPRTQECVHTRG